jgi:hypothetical protein
MFINTRPESNVLLKSCPGFIEFPATNSSASFFVDSNQTYSGVIRSVTYTFKRLSDNAQISYTTGESGDHLSNFVDPYLQIRKSTTTEGVKITVDAQMPSEM